MADRKTTTAVKSMLLLVVECILLLASSCSDKLPEIPYSNVDLTIENPDVVTIIKEELYFGTTMTDEILTVASVKGPYIEYYVYEDGSIVVSAALYYVIYENGRRSQISLNTAFYNDINESDAPALDIDYVPDYSNDSIVNSLYRTPNMLKHFGDSYMHEPHVFIGNQYCTYIVTKDETFRRYRAYDFPNPPDGIVELVEDIANRYGDELLELAPEAVEVPLELLNTERE